MNEQLVHHYPPELLNLLVDAIPRLLKGKQSVLDFFKGCGVAPAVYADLQLRVRQDRDSINKFDIVRQVLTRLNDKGDATLRERREVLKRVVQWEDFSTGYPEKRAEAEGFVAKIQKVVNVKDSFTRISQERDVEAERRKQERESELKHAAELRQEREHVRKDFYDLFGMTDTKRRGKALEGVLNRLFKCEGVLIREAFHIVGREGEGVVEQIDGVVEIDGHVYLVEMKWWDKPLGTAEIAHPIVRLYSRSEARGIVISASSFTDPAVTQCREALQQRVCVLATLEEIVVVLEKNSSFVETIRLKVRAAITDKNPFFEPHKCQV